MLLPRGTVSGTAIAEASCACAALEHRSRQPVTVNLPVLRELVRICDYEAEVAWVAGVGSPNRYTPRVLADPSRLVIDIAH